MNRKIDEISRLEYLVERLEFNHYFPYPERDYRVEEAIMQRTLYYIKLGVKPKDLIYKHRKFIKKEFTKKYQKELFSEL